MSEMEEWSNGYSAGRRDERAEHIEDTDRMVRRLKELQSYLEEAAQEERALIVKYLRNSWTILVSIDDLACGIENGEHLRSNNE